MNINKILNTKQIVNFICSFLVCISLITVIICILYNANWILGDDMQFLETTAINKPIKIWSGCGRYWPMGFFDYNILLFIPYGCTPLGHYIYCAITFLIFSALFVFLLKKIIDKNMDNLRYPIITFYFIALISASGFLRIHSDVIFPERIMITLLSIFMFYYFIALKTQDTRHYIIAFFTACYLTYCKEPMFGVFVVIALTNIIFGNSEKGHKQRLFNYALIVNAVIYILQWYFIVFRESTKYYYPVYGDNRAYTETIPATLNSECMLVSIFLLFFSRAYFVLFKKDNKNLYFDGLLFSSVAYAIAFIIMKLDADYYFVPSILLAIPTFTKWTCYCIEKGKKHISVWVMIIMLVPMIMNFPAITNRLEIVQHKRKYDMKTLEMVVNLIKSGAQIYFCNNLKLDSNYLKNMWEKFIEYRIGDKFIIESTVDLTSISNNGIILYPAVLGKEDPVIVSELNQKKFYFIARAGITNIYVYENYCAPAKL